MGSISGVLVIGVSLSLVVVVVVGIVVGAVVLGVIVPLLLPLLVPLADWYFWSALFSKY